MEEVIRFGENQNNAKNMHKTPWSIQTGSSAYDGDWAETSLEEITTGLKTNFLCPKHAVDHGKTTPEVWG